MPIIFNILFTYIQTHVLQFYKNRKKNFFEELQRKQLFIEKQTVRQKEKSQKFKKKRLIKTKNYGVFFSAKKISPSYKAH